MQRLKLGYKIIWLAALLGSLLVVSCGKEDTKVSPYVGGSEATDSTQKFEDGDTVFSGKAFGDLVYLSWEAAEGANWVVLRQNLSYQQTPNFLVRLPIETTSYKDHNLLAEQTYYYQLQLCASETSCSVAGQTLQLSATEPDAPTEIPIIRDVTYDYVDNYIRISWDVVESADTYSLWRSELTGSQVADAVSLPAVRDTTATTDRGISQNRRYVYKIRVCASNNKCSVFSDQHAIAIGVNIIADPVFDLQQLHGDSITISWSRIALADNYEVQRRVDDGPYLLADSSGSSRFVDSVAAVENSITLRYKVRGISSKWGNSNWVESREFVVPATTTNASEADLVSARALARSVLQIPDFVLAAPIMLMSPRGVYIFLNSDLYADTSSYFRIHVDQQAPKILSSNNRAVHLAYTAGEPIEIFSCSDKYLACEKSFIVKTDDLRIPEGQSRQPVISARLPEELELYWHSDLPEHFIYIAETDTDKDLQSFYRLLNPSSTGSSTQIARIAGLAQDKNYLISVINCYKTEQDLPYLCLDKSERVAHKVPEYGLDIDFAWLQGKWDKGAAPTFAFESSAKDKLHHLVIDRQCVGLSCQDRAWDMRLRLDSILTGQGSTLVVDNPLAGETPVEMVQHDDKIDIVYYLSLCFADWSQCSRKTRLQLSRSNSKTRIMGINPAVLSRTAPMKLALAHFQREEQSPMRLLLERYFSDELTTALVQNFSLVEQQDYSLADENISGQIIRIDKINPFVSALPWYSYRKQLDLSIEMQSERITGSANILMQDDLDTLGVEGVARILLVNERVLCLALNDGSVSCWGDSSLVSAHLADLNSRVMASSIAQHITAPVLPMYSFSKTGACQEGSADLTKVFSPRSSIVQASGSSCVISDKGQPLCLEGRDTDISADSISSASLYLCPLASDKALNQLEATTGARHLCSLDDEGQSYCWGNLAAVVPELPQTVYRNPEKISFFTAGEDAPPIDSILSGRDYTCMSSQGEEYCYSEVNHWIDDGAPARVQFPSVSGTPLDRAAYGSLACWLNYDRGAAYVDCVKSKGQPTLYELPDELSPIDLVNNSIQAFLIARLSANLSNRARLWLTRKAVCIFDAPSLWCAGDLGYNDYIYGASPLELKAITLPYAQPHDFAASDDGRFCVIYGFDRRFGCWQTQTKSSSTEEQPLPKNFWPLMLDEPAYGITLTPEYSCASFDSSLGCWGKSVNPVVGSGGQTDSLVRTSPQIHNIGLGIRVSDLVSGKSTSCYKSLRKWKCWGRLSHLAQWLEQSETKPVSISEALSLSHEIDIEALSLAKHFHGLCAVVADDGYILCSGISGTSHTSDNDEQDAQLTPITDNTGQILYAAGRPVFVGKYGACALARTGENEAHAVYCWGSNEFSNSEVTEHSNRAVVVIDGLPAEALLISASNSDASLSVVLVYNTQTGEVEYWGRNKQHRIASKPMSWHLDIQDLAIWPANEPVLLGLTDTGQVYWQNLVDPHRFGSLSGLPKTNALVTGTDNICIRQEVGGQLLCAGDNRFGKSGLIESVTASGIIMPP